MELFDSFPYRYPIPLINSQRNDCLLRLYANQIILNHSLSRETWLYESVRVRRPSYYREESLLLKNFSRSDTLIRRFRTLIYLRSRCPAWETIDRRMMWTKEYSRRIRLAALYLKELHLDVKHDLTHPSCCRQIRFSASRIFYLQTNTNQRDSYSCSYKSPCSRQIFLKVSGSTDMPPLTNSVSFVRTAKIRRFISRTSWTWEKSKLEHNRLSLRSPSQLRMTLTRTGLSAIYQIHEQTREWSFSHYTTVYICTEIRRIFRPRWTMTWLFELFPLCSLNRNSRSSYTFSVTASPSVVFIDSKEQSDRKIYVRSTYQ